MYFKNEYIDSLLQRQSEREKLGRSSKENKPPFKRGSIHVGIAYYINFKRKKDEEIVSVGVNDFQKQFAEKVATDNIAVPQSQLLEMASSEPKEEVILNHIQRMTRMESFGPSAELITRQMNGVYEILPPCNNESIKQQVDNL